jgi:hypothetical protein
MKNQNPTTFDFSILPADTKIRFVPSPPLEYRFAEVWDVTCPAVDPDSPKCDEEFRTISAWLDEQRGSKRVAGSLLESLEETIERRSMQDAMVFYRNSTHCWVIRCHTEEDAVKAKLRWSEGT